MHVKFIKLGYCVLRNANNLNNATTKLNDLHLDLQTYFVVEGNNNHIYGQHNMKRELT